MTGTEERSIQSGYKVVKTERLSFVREKPFLREYWVRVYARQWIMKNWVIASSSKVCTYLTFDCPWNRENTTMRARNRWGRVSRPISQED